MSATVGAAFAIVLALAAQVVAHLVNTGHMDHNQAWLIAVTSMVPPAVLAHLLHLAATPVPQQAAPAEERPAAPVPAPPLERAEPPVPPKPEHAPPLPAPEAQQLELEPKGPERPAIRYSDPRCAIIRPLYEDGYRPTTGEMRAALEAANPHRALSVHAPRRPPRRDREA
ncbi:hypothetical protein ACRJ4W_07155 [Streptomyces sp. GLT-R25]